MRWPTQDTGPHLAFAGQIIETGTVSFRLSTARARKAGRQQPTTQAKASLR